MFSLPGVRFSGRRMREPATVTRSRIVPMSRLTGIASIRRRSIHRFPSSLGLSPKASSSSAARSSTEISIPSSPIGSGVIMRSIGAVPSTPSARRGERVSAYPKPFATMKYSPASGGARVNRPSEPDSDCAFCAPSREISEMTAPPIGVSLTWSRTRPTRVCAWSGGAHARATATRTAALRVTVLRGARMAASRAARGSRWHP